MSKTIWVIRDDYVGTGDFPSGATPEEANLLKNREYLVLKIDYDEIHNEAVLLVVNDSGEIWSLSNSHLRVSSVYENGILLFSSNQGID